MSNKELNLRLNYDGKVLDQVKYKRDFKTNFFIGSDKSLFWQILDNKFPEKHKLLTKKGDNYNLHLLNEMKIDLKVGDQIFNNQDLIEKNLLKNNNILLKDSYEGNIKLNPRWDIDFYYKKPYIKKISTAERAIIKQYARYSELNPEQKFTMIFLLLAFIVTVFGIFIFEKNFTPKIIENTIARRAAQRRVQASAVNIPKTITGEKIVEEPKIIESEETDSKIQDEPKISQKDKTTLEDDFTRIFGTGVTGKSNKQASQDDELALITTQVAIKAGVAENKGRGHSTTDNAGKSIGRESIEGAFSDLSDFTDSNIESLGDLSDVDLSMESLNDVELSEDIALSNKIEKKKVVSVNQKNDFKATKKKFTFAKQIDAKEIKLNTSSPKESNLVTKLDHYINTYKPRLTKLYNTEKWKQNLYGTVDVTLLINQNGTVEGVEIIPYKQSKFSEDFLEKARNEILNWKIPVEEMVEYTFTMTFMNQ